MAIPWEKIFCCGGGGWSLVKWRWSEVDEGETIRIQTIRQCKKEGLGGIMAGYELGETYGCKTVKAIINDDDWLSVKSGTALRCRGITVAVTVGEPSSRVMRHEVELSDSYLHSAVCRRSVTSLHLHGSLPVRQTIWLFHNLVILNHFIHILYFFSIPSVLILSNDVMRF